MKTQLLSKQNPRRSIWVAGEKSLRPSALTIGVKKSNGPVVNGTGPCFTLVNHFLESARAKRSPAPMNRWLGPGTSASLNRGASRQGRTSPAVTWLVSGTVTDTETCASVTGRIGGRSSQVQRWTPLAQCGLRASEHP